MVEWSNLKIGDKVKIVSWPLEYPKEKLHQDTIEFYEWLIKTQAIFTITEIDDFGMPIGTLSRVVDEKEQGEFLTLNHGGIELLE